MKKIIFILITMFVFCSGFNPPKVDTGSKIKAIFIMNFTKLIEWPRLETDKAFVVGVVGDTPLLKELKKMSLTKRVASQALEIKSFSTAKEIEKCQILYVSRNKSHDIYSLIKKVGKNNTLIITEKEGLVDKGAGINFIIKNNRQKFELNKKNVEKYKLKVSSNLESLAFKVK